MRNMEKPVQKLQPKGNSGLFFIGDYDSNEQLLNRAETASITMLHERSPA